MFPLSTTRCGRLRDEPFSFFFGTRLVCFSLTFRDPIRTLPLFSPRADENECKTRPRRVCRWFFFADVFSRSYDEHAFFFSAVRVFCSMNGRRSVDGREKRRSPDVATAVRRNGTNARRTRTNFTGNFTAMHMGKDVFDFCSSLAPHRVRVESRMSIDDSGREKKQNEPLTFT